MRTAAVAKVPRDTLNLRIPVEERNLIDMAALSTGKTRTDFILEAVRKAAEEALLDRVFLSVGEEAFAEFGRRLDAPTSPNDRLRRTMQAAAPWEKA